MTSVKINWEKCEHDLDNIWYNIKELDPINNLQLMGMVLSSYYKFHKNTFEAFYNDTTLYGCVDYMKRWNPNQMHNWYIIDEDNGYKFKMNQNNELVMA